MHATLKKIPKREIHFWTREQHFGYRILQLPWMTTRGVRPNELIRIAFGHNVGRENQKVFEIKSDLLTQEMCEEDEDFYQRGLLKIIHESHARNIYERFTVENSDKTTRNILYGRPNTLTAEVYRFGLPRKYDLLNFEENAIVFNVDIKSVFYVSLKG